MALSLTGAASLALTAPVHGAVLRAARASGSRRAASRRSRRSRPTPTRTSRRTPGQHLWRWLQTFPRAEGSLFPGVVPIVLTLVGAWAGVRRRRARRPTHADRRALASRRGAIASLLSCVAALYSLHLRWACSSASRGVTWSGRIEVRLFSVVRPLAIAVGAGAALLALSPRRVRAPWGVLVRHPSCFAAVRGAFSRSGCRWVRCRACSATRCATRRSTRGFYEHVPGFGGLRVPARFAMIVMLFLAWAPGSGIARSPRRRGAVAVSARARRRPRRRVRRAAADERSGGERRVPRAARPRFHGADRLTRAIDALPGERGARRAAVRRHLVGDSLPLSVDVPLAAHGERLQRRRAGALRPHA